MNMPMSSKSGMQSIGYFYHLRSFARILQINKQGHLPVIQPVHTYFQPPHHGFSQVVQVLLLQIVQDFSLKIQHLRKESQRCNSHPCMSKYTCVCTYIYIYVQYCINVCLHTNSSCSYSMQRKCLKIHWPDFCSG